MTVDIDFVGDGPWGTGLTRRLTKGELNNNFWALKQAVEAVSETAGVSVEDIIVTGRHVTFQMSDGSTKGPFVLPYAKFRWRGRWTALTSYAELDLVRAGNLGIYLVLEAHVSASTFDPDRSDSSGNFYRQLFGSSIAVPRIVTGSTFTPDPDEVGGFFNMTNSGGCAVTMPEDPDDGDEYHFRQGSTGPLAFTGSSAAPIDGVTGFSDGTSVMGAVVTVKFYAGSWFLFGNLAPASA